MNVSHRGPQQVLRGDEGKGKQRALPENARVTLAQMLKEGLGDHILLLRLYQVNLTAASGLLERSLHLCWSSRSQCSI